ncbi:MAG: TraR/DksA C4-type zinc finger protein [Actinomycetota bacterium]|nr:TraR/DksA C4-type zinc finger protein [Actinomycetota bacterium]
MPPTNIVKTAADLRGEQVTLLHQLAELGADKNGEFTGEMVFGDAFADAGAATAERTETMGIIENLKTHLDDVERAIARIEDGTYGSCTECGGPIGDDRLECLPTSVMCIECKTKAS